MSKRKPVQVWAWDDAPEEYRELSGHGGDEDWVALVSPEWSSKYIGWLREGVFGDRVSEYRRKSGELVVIGYDAPYRGYWYPR